MISRRSFASGALGLLAAAPAVPASAARLRWPGHAKAAVSLTYDDGLDSQIDNAVPVLQAFGFKATFFLTRDNMLERTADWQSVARLGHEMGNHSVTHPCDLKGCTTARFRAQEVAPMEAFLDDKFGTGRFRSYAYPCGYTELGGGDPLQAQARYREALQGEVAAARTVRGPPNDPRQAVADPLMLTAYQPTYNVDDPALAQPYVREAMAKGGWAILVFHEVLPKRMGEGDTSAASHQQILSWLKSQPVWCAPVGEVFRHCAARAA